MKVLQHHQDCSQNRETHSADILSASYSPSHILGCAPLKLTSINANIQTNNKLNGDITN